MRIGVLLLVVCAVVTTVRLPAWHSDLALWQAAAAVTPTRPRPALNIASALIDQGRYLDAAGWSMRGRWLMLVAPERAHEWAAVEGVVRTQLRWIDGFTPVCHIAPFASAC